LITPFPLPVVVPLGKIQSALLETDHVQVGGAVTVALPLPPEAGTVVVENCKVAQGVSYCTPTCMPLDVAPLTVNVSSELVSDQDCPDVKAAFRKLLGLDTGLKSNR
jgi:hypothetical protein